MVNLEEHSAVSTHLSTLQPISGRDKQPSREDHIFLSYGSPSPALFPVEAYKQASMEVLETKGEVALQYAGGKGSQLIKKWIIDRGKRRNINIREDNILLTAGAAQAIDFTTRLLINPGDEVWVEKPTYFFALQSFQLAGATIQMFPMTADGIDVDMLEKELIHRSKTKQKMPKLVYTMPNYHNPTGITICVERRKKLAQLAKQYDFYLIEDDAYVEIGFDGREIPAIHSFAPDRVLYLGTLSKVIAPGIRIGWAIAPELFINKMKLLLLGPQISPVTQEIVGNLLQRISFDTHMSQIITTYRKKRDVMITAIQQYFNKDVAFTIPTGGFFIWLQFQQNIDTERLLDIAFENGVSAVQDKVFYDEQVGDSTGDPAIRLCYSFCDEDEIERGVQLLARAYYSLITLI